MSMLSLLERAQLRRLLAWRFRAVKNAAYPLTNANETVANVVRLPADTASRSCGRSHASNSQRGSEERHNKPNGVVKARLGELARAAQGGEFVRLRRARISTRVSLVSTSMPCAELCCVVRFLRLGYVEVRSHSGSVKVVGAVACRSVQRVVCRCLRRNLEQSRRRSGRFRHRYDQQQHASWRERYGEHDDQHECSHHRSH